MYEGFPICLALMPKEKMINVAAVLKAVQCNLIATLYPALCGCGGLIFQRPEKLKFTDLDMVFFYLLFRLSIILIEGGGLLSVLMT